MASKFSIFLFVFVIKVAFFYNNICLFVVAIESSTSTYEAREVFTEKNNINYTNILLTHLKRERINFDSLKLLTVIQDDRNDTIFSFDEYYNITQIHNYMEHLGKKYKDIVEILSIGQTWEKRSIKTMKISSRNSNNSSAIWIDGGIHAREWISISSVLFIMNALLTNWFSLDPVFRSVDYYITPVLNPDGYEFSRNSNRFWRLNRRKIGICHGVDLNRNFPYKWNEINESRLFNIPKRRACGEEYAGLAPSSEPETEAVINFIARFPGKFKGFLTFHSYGKTILYPYGYDFRIPKSFVKLYHIAQTAADKIYNVTGQKYDVTSGNMLYLFAGNSMDWAYKVAKIPYSYLIELRNDDSFDLPPSEIVPAGKEALIIVMTLVNNFDSSAETPMSAPTNLNYENIVVESDE